MKILTILLLALAIGTSLSGQSIPILSYEELDEQIRSGNEDEVLVVNFWATWCKPCIKELPYFDSLQSVYSAKQVKVLLVSLDMEAEAAEKYREKKNIQSQVVYLDEVDHNAWIDSISEEWSGAIPATLFVGKSGKEYFHEGELSDQALFEQVNQLLTSN